MNFQRVTRLPPLEGWTLPASLAALAALFLLAVLTAGGPPAAAQTFFTFRCGDGSEFVTAFYQGTRSAYVKLDGKSLVLPRRLSLSGARYSSGGIVLRIKGDAATLSRGRQSTDCSSV
jgi:membrane-bound inhibitor of C-type lysozyme